MATVPEVEVDAFEAHIAPESTRCEQPSFPAVLAILDPEHGTLQSTIGLWQGVEPGIKIHLRATTREAFDSFLRIRLCIRYGTPDSEGILQDSADIYLAAAQVTSMQLTQILAQDAELQGGQAHAPSALFTTCPGSEQWVQANLLWQLDIDLAANQFNECNVFSPRQFGDQTTLIDQLRTYLKQTERLRFYLVAQDPHPSITLLTDRFQQDISANPIDAWYPKHPRRHFIQAGDYPKADERPVVEPLVKYSFRTWSEYQTTMGYAAIYEHENHIRTVQALEELTLNLRFLTVPGADNRRYLAFLELPPASEGDIVELYPDDHLTVTFNTDLSEADPGDDWSATVAKPIVTTPPGHVPMWLTRKWSFEDGLMVLPEEIEPEDVFGATTPKDAYRTLCAQPPRPVRVKVIDSIRPFLASIRSLHHMQENVMNNRPLLLGNHLSDLPRVNLFDGLGNGPDHLVQQFSFNQEQIQGFHMMKRLVHGLGVVHGPPGTGKTFWLLRVLLTLLLPKPAKQARRRQVMILGPSNTVVDMIASDMNDLIAQYDSQPESDVIVIRLHALSTEEELMEEPATRDHPPSATARPPVIQPLEDNVILQEMSTASLVANLHQQFAARPAGVNDRRVTQVRLSLGHRMLQLAGIVPAPWSQPDQFAEVRQMWFLRKSGPEFTQEQCHAFTAAIRELRDATLRRSDVVVCTPFTTSKLPVYQNVHPHAIIVDEAGQLHDSDLWPIFAYLNPVGLILVGDHKQLRPTVFSNIHTNPFVDQLHLSLFGRLKILGLMDIMFCEQRRMISPICGLVSEVFYQGRLRTSAHLPQLVINTSRQLTQYINGEPFRKQHTLSFMDIGGDCEELRDARGRSTLNKTSCATAFALANELVNNAGILADQITILTPYRAQLHLYHTLFSTHQNVRDVNIHTVDSFQGSENVVVIFDITASSRPQFLANANRLNVALSRARAAMFVIGGWMQLLRPDAGKLPGHKGKVLAAVMKYFLSHRLKAPVPASFTPDIDLAKTYIAGFDTEGAGTQDATTVAQDGGWPSTADDPDTTTSAQAGGWTSTVDVPDTTTSAQAGGWTSTADNPDITTSAHGYEWTSPADDPNTTTGAQAGGWTSTISVPDIIMDEEAGGEDGPESSMEEPTNADEELHSDPLSTADILMQDMEYATSAETGSDDQ